MMISICETKSGMIFSKELFLSVFFMVGIEVMHNGIGGSYAWAFITKE